MLTFIFTDKNECSIIYGNPPELHKPSFTKLNE